MASAEQPSLQLSCGSCGGLMQVPAQLAGQTCGCPHCQALLTVPGQSLPRAQPIAQSNLPPVRATQPASGTNLPPVRNPEPQPESPFPNIQTHGSGSMTERANQFAVEEQRRSGAFAPEKRGLDAGVVGGLLMMLIGIVWFVGGLACGLIFYYAPILFLIGLFGFFKGLLTGNFTGNKRRRRY